MHLKKTWVLIMLSLLMVFGACAKKEEKAEAPKQNVITKNLVPPKTEIKGDTFHVELSDLKATIIEDTASKEIVETPELRAQVRITNLTKSVLDIDAITLEFLDEAGKQIEFESGEKVAKAHLYLKILKPQESFNANLNATIPRSAIKQNSLSKIEINVVYTQTPLRRETMTLSEKVE